MTNKPNKTLKEIRNLFDKAQKEGRLQQLWNILTALRGPDFDQTNDLKTKYTTPIRESVLTSSQADKLNLTDYRNWPKIRKNDVVIDFSTTEEWSHFLDHIYFATKAINKRD